MPTGIGRPDSSGVDVTRDLLTRLRGLRELANGSLQKLSVVLGLGPAWAAQILAAVESGKRAFYKVI